MTHFGPLLVVGPILDFWANHTEAAERSKAAAGHIYDQNNVKTKTKSKERQYTCPIAKTHEHSRQQSMAIKPESTGAPQTEPKTLKWDPRGGPRSKTAVQGVRTQSDSMLPETPTRWPHGTKTPPIMC
jgi:hypothetical protein